MASREQIIKNRKMGYAYEHRTVEWLKSHGAELVQRSAGSHSPVDIWCVKGDTLFLIQCKSGGAKLEKERKDLITLAKKIKTVVPISCFTEGGLKKFIDLASGMDFKKVLEWK